MRLTENGTLCLSYFQKSRNELSLLPLLHNSQQHAMHIKQTFLSSPSSQNRCPRAVTEQDYAQAKKDIKPTTLSIMYGMLLPFFS